VSEPNESETALTRSQAAELSSGSVEEFLLALADGVNRAQRQLSQISVQLQPGQPAISYELPRLDFEFRVTFELSSTSDQFGSSSSFDNGQILRLRPAGRRPGSDTSATQATSLIKGSFVAMPAHGGKPPQVVNVELIRLSAHRLKFQVEISSAAGEKLSGIPVEFNIDHNLSRKLNKGKELDPTTEMQIGVVYTNQSGAGTTALVADTEPNGKYVAVVVTAASETQTFVFRVDQSA